MTRANEPKMLHTAQKFTNFSSSLWLRCFAPNDMFYEHRGCVDASKLCWICCSYFECDTSLQILLLSYTSRADLLFFVH